MIKIKRFLVVVFVGVFLIDGFGFGFIANANAWQRVNHWATLQEAKSAPNNAPFYYPKTHHRLFRRLPRNEAIGTLYKDSFVLMDLPRSLGGRGWVKINSGRRVVYDSRSGGKILRLYECNNRIYAVVTIQEQKVVAPVVTVHHYQNYYQNYKIAPQPQQQKQSSGIGLFGWILGAVAVGLGVILLTRHHHGGGGGGGSPPGGRTGGVR